MQRGTDAVLQTDKAQMLSLGCFDVHFTYTSRTKAVVKFFIKNFNMPFAVNTTTPFRLEDFRKSRLDMDIDNGLPYESVPPVQIRT